MDISLIIPCHNLEKHIAPLLTTLNQQQLFNLEVEIIFAFDDCTDKTKEMIDLLLDAPQYKAIKKCDCNVHCCGLAREEGRKLATGDYIWFVDGDDWLIGAWAIAKVMNELKANSDMEMLRLGYVVPEYFQAKGYFSMVWQYVYKSSFIEDIHFTDVQPHEDVEFMKLVIEKLDGREILDVKDCLYYYNYFREGSVMRNYFNEHPRGDQAASQETKE